MNKPQIIFFDIETLPAQFWGWRLGEQRVEYGQIKKEPVVAVICYAINDGKVNTLTMDLSKYKIDEYDDNSDQEMLKKFVSIVNECHLGVAHNGKFFDVAFMRSRLIKYRLPDIQIKLLDDTYLKTKTIGLMSHKLDYMLRYLGLGEKVKNDGLPMWTSVAHKNKKAFAEMCTYCVGDVEKLRKLYNYIKPYINSDLNMAIFNEDPNSCPRCGSKQLQKRGFLYSTTFKRQRYQCTNCGWWGSSGKNLLHKPTNYNR